MERWKVKKGGNERDEPDGNKEKQIQDCIPRFSPP